MIRIEAVWLCTTPIDIRAGTDGLLARIVQVFGAVRPHHAYVFSNRRSTRLKVVVHDGVGVWLAARRLYEGRFVWPGSGADAAQSITHEQLDVLVMGLPWHRVGPAGTITAL